MIIRIGHTIILWWSLLSYIEHIFHVANRYMYYLVTWRCRQSSVHPLGSRPKQTVNTLTRLLNYFYPWFPGTFTQKRRQKWDKTDSLRQNTACLKQTCTPVLEILHHCWSRWRWHLEGLKKLFQVAKFLFEVQKASIFLSGPKLPRGHLGFLYGPKIAVLKVCKGLFRGLFGSSVTPWTHGPSKLHT